VVRKESTKKQQAKSSLGKNHVIDFHTMKKLSVSTTIRQTKKINEFESKIAD